MVLAGRLASCKRFVPRMGNFRNILMRVSQIRGSILGVPIAWFILESPYSWNLAYTLKYFSPYCRGFLQWTRSFLEAT